MSFSTEKFDTSTDLPLVRPAAPIPHKHDPNRFSWIKYVRDGANLLAEWDEHHYSHKTFPITVAGMDVCYLNDDALIEEVMQDTSGRFVRSRIQSLVLEPVLGQGLLSVDGEQWRNQRKVMAPVFQPRQVATFEQQMRDATQKLVDKWKAQPPRRAVDMLPVMSSLTLDFIAEALFGGLEPKQHALLATNTHRGLSRIPLMNVVIMLNPIKSINMHISHFTLRKQIKQLDEISADFIKRYRQDESSQKDSLLGRLIAAQESDQDGVIDERFVRDQIATFLLAGHETTAKALAFALYTLTVDKPRKDKLLASLAVDGDKSEYLDWVIKEVLRLYPPAVIMNRDAAEDTTVGDMKIKKDTMLMISPWLVGRNPNSWEQADKFWPERWEHETIKERRYSYLPFGAGPHICIGAGLALSELKIMLTGLLLNFDFEFADRYPVVPNMAVTISAKHGIWLNVTPRQG